MAITERLALIIDANGQGAVKELEKVGKTAERELGKAESSLEKFGSQFSTVGATALAGAAVMGAALWNAAGATSALNEQVAATEQVFGGASDVVADFAKSAEAIGFSERAAREAAATFGLFFTNAGKSKQEAAEMSVEMTKLAADMASFRDTSPEQAIEAIGAALRGESEPIRFYGVMLDDATLKQRALDMGLVKTTKGTLPPAIKMQAAYAEILAQTGTIQGDVARNMGTAAQIQRQSAAEMENAKAAIGEGFLPVMAALTSALGDGADAFATLNERTGGAASQFLALSTVALGVGGGMAFIGGQTMQTIAALKKAKDAGNVWASATLAAIGPVAIAVASLAAVWMAYQWQVNEADGAMRDMVDTLDGLTTEGSFEDLVRQEAELVKQHNQMIDESAKGLDFWNNARKQAYKDASHETGSVIEQMQLQILAAQRLADETAESTDSALAWIRTQEQAGVVFSNVDQVLAMYEAELDATGGAVVDLTAKEAEANKEREKAISQLDKMIKKVDKYFGALDSPLDLQLAWEASNRAFAESLKENGLAWDWVNNRLNTNTEEGLAQLEVMRGQREAAIDMGQAILQSGGSIEDATDATLLHVAAMNEQWRRAGYSEEQIAILNSTLGLTPDAVTTAFNQPGMEESVRAAQGYAAVLAGIPREVGTKVWNTVGGMFGFGGPEERASGGPVSPGRPYLVGERGPELVTFAQSGMVHSADRTASMVGGGAPVIHQHFEGVPIDAQIEAANRRLANTLAAVSLGG